MSDTPPPPPPYLPPPPPPPGQGPGPGPAPAPVPSPPYGGPPAYGGANPYGAGPPPYGFAPQQVAPPSRSGKALAGFVLGLCSIVLFMTVIVPLLALIFGLLGAREVKRSNGARTGLGKARWGWILGLLGLIGGAAIWVAVGADLAGTTSVNDLEVGQCVDRPGDGDSVSRLHTYDCDESHEAEVIAVGDLGSGKDPYPGDSEVSSETERQCSSAFRDYVGRPVLGSDLSVYMLVPTEDNWDSDQTYICLAYLKTGAKLTESVADSRR